MLVFIENIIPQAESPQGMLFETNFRNVPLSLEES